ncbi:MAG: type I restriction enzyme S subunit [Oleiphilaceae bacterium]|jgi:type I restriction enzyme S subunit
MKEVEIRPSLRFDDFNQDWRIVKLGELGSTINGLTYSPSNIVENGLLVLRSSNVQNGELSFIDNVYVDIDVSREYKTKINDILICVRNGSKRLIGKSALVKNSALNSTHGAFMSVFRGENSHFTFQLFQTENYRRQVYADLGATINSINGKNLLSYRFEVPCSIEQQKIADFLSSVDKKINLLKNKMQLLSQYKKSVMQQLFSQLIRFKDDNNEAFPDWKEYRFSNILKLQLNTLKMNDETEYELITVRRRNGGVDSRGIYKGKEVLVKSQFELKTNQFVISKRQIVHGACGLVPEHLAGAIVSNEYNVFEAESEKLDINYFNIIAATLPMRRAFFINSSGVHIEKLLFKTQSWLKTKLDFPCVAEQRKIVEVLSSLDKKIELVNQQIEHTQAFKKGLLQQMFV